MHDIMNATLRESLGWALLFLLFGFILGRLRK